MTDPCAHTDCACLRRPPAHCGCVVCCCCGTDAQRRELDEVELQLQLELPPTTDPERKGWNR